MTLMVDFHRLWKSLSHVQLFVTPLTIQSMEFYSPWNSTGQNTGVSYHALLQGSSHPRDQTQVSHIAGRFFTVWATREALSWAGIYLKKDFLSESWNWMIQEDTLSVSLPHGRVEISQLCGLLFCLYILLFKQTEKDRSVLIPLQFSYLSLNCIYKAKSNWKTVKRNSYL